MALVVTNLTDTFDEWRIKTNSLGTQTGDLTTLSTTNKSSLAASINEVFANDATRLTNLVEDTSPQLGGNLDLNSNNITGTGNITFTGILTATSIAGTVVGTTQSAGNNSTALATTAYVDAQVATEDTIAELNDTTVSSPANLDLFQYNTGTSTWVNTSSLDVIVGGLQSLSNGHITIAPHGTGDVRLETDKVRLGSSGEDVTLTTYGSGTLTMGPNDAGSGMPVIVLENAGRILFNCVSGQPCIIDGNVQATSYAGDLNGTINTATTGTTQSASNNSTLIATTAYVDAQVATENTIAEMDDTTMSGLANLDILQYNGSAWINRTMTAAGVPTTGFTVAMAIALG